MFLCILCPVDTCGNVIRNIVSVKISVFQNKHPKFRTFKIKECLYFFHTSYTFATVWEPWITAIWRLKPHFYTSYTDHISACVHSNHWHFCCFYESILILVWSFYMKHFLTKLWKLHFSNISTLVLTWFMPLRRENRHYLFFTESKPTLEPGMCKSTVSGMASNTVLGRNLGFTPFFFIKVPDCDSIPCSICWKDFVRVSSIRPEKKQPIKQGFNIGNNVLTFWINS